MSAEHKTSSGAASVGAMFLQRVELTPDWEAFRKPTGSGWKSFTWAETGTIVNEWAAGLLAIGVKPEQRVAIASGTTVEWIFADLAIMCSGAATTTVYPSTPADDVAYILADSGSVVVFAEDASQLEKLQSVRDQIPDVHKVILLSGSGDGDFVISADELAELGRAKLRENPDAVKNEVASVKPDDLATIIYTSGTTGKPKGVRLPQSNWVYEGEAIDAVGIIQHDWLQFLWLPLAHSFGKVLISGQLKIGFPTAVDGDVPKIGANLAAVKPLWMAGVPRVFEKIYGGVQLLQENEGGVKLKIFRWAEGVGARAGEARRAGKPVTGVLAVQHSLADKLVFSKIRERMGGRMKYFVSGSAALSRDVAEWFDNVGLTVLEGYGLTETSAFTFITRPTNYEFGTVGEPAPGTEVMIESDGEIMIKGPGVMEGYHNLDEQTAEVFNEHGWFHTGDIGEIDEGGRLKITDRKKDLIKTAGGKYVAPQGIETKFKATCPYGSNIVVHGDGRKFVSALVTLDPDAIATWAAEHGVSGDYAAIVSNPKTKEMVTGYIDQVNAQLPQWETIKKFEILPADLSIEEGELTPSLKVKRKVVEQKHSDLLDGFYK